MKRYVPYFLTVAAVALAALSLDTSGSNWMPDRIEQSKQIGDRIVAAADAYHAAHGQYPSSLDLLVPEYIERIDPPVAGTGRWDYHVLKDGSGQLAFGQGEHLYPCCYIKRPGMNAWRVDN